MKHLLAGLGALALIALPRIGAAAPKAMAAKLVTLCGGHT